MSLSVCFRFLPCVMMLACVGDSSIPIPDASSNDATITDSAVDVKGPTCADAGPQVLNTGPQGSGPYCAPGNGIDGGSYCAFGAHCCVTQGTADTCADTCPGTSADIACLGSADCSQDAGAMVCCVDGTLDTTTCSYPRFTSLLHATCASSCTASQLTFCASNGDCQSPAKCVGATTSYGSYSVAICR